MKIHIGTQKKSNNINKTRFNQLVQRQNISKHFESQEKLYDKKKSIKCKIYKISKTQDLDK